MLFPIWSKAAIRASEVLAMKAWLCELAQPFSRLRPWLSIGSPEVLKPIV